MTNRKLEDMKVAHTALGANASLVAALALLPLQHWCLAIF